MTAHQLTDLYAQVLLDVPLGVLDYRVAEDMMVAPGDRVLVTLQTRRMVGVVASVRTSTDIEGRRIKSILRVLTETGPLSQEWLDLTRFAASYYQRTWGEAALPALPAFFREAPKDTTRRETRLKKMRELKSVHTSPSVVPELNDQQKAAVQAVSSSTGFGVFVLFGVTGSGKTEVYLHLMQEVLARDPEAQVLLLVPEINLTPQLEARVRARFVNEQVVTLHSELAQGERAASWLAVHEGRARVLVGTRTAVFASFRRLALILVDEEHDSSYKAGDGLRHSARDLAVKRAHGNGIACVLGSATPSLETWSRVESGRYQLLTLSERAVSHARLPKLQLVDVRGKSRAVFDPITVEAVTQAIARGEQVLVFMNRRGYAPVLSCTACGWASRCVHCSGFTVFHKASRQLICHHCGTRYPVVPRCPSCGNPEIVAEGVGTERVEEAIGQMWPEARVLRIDRDSVRAKGEAEKAFGRIHAGEVDIVVGTQMIAKGHDFQRISLVVVLNADAQLQSPDIRAEERLFSTLMQVSGRAGRGEIPGTVLVQTRFPEHPLYAALRAQSYRQYADRALADRREAFAPPYLYQAVMRAESARIDGALLQLEQAARVAQGLLTEGVMLYDPVPMSMMRLMDVERAELLVESESRPELQAFLRAWGAAVETLPGVSWYIEVDPAEM